ncbi:HAMP domain-containing histidine kinase [Patescibacteria group bacterium]|nr:HAMP domain-containing histidine kinase [Patescibacteria group bacterium]MDE1946863.1 HAMP domain-containing histidine kinase [Patescibacteria group bacterium]MDE2010683.1 HAMP domain-containing histidine kinase [Patescibacteria group bacterium]MDE2232711.1 HAMP domain-containing histidine kinase [Patescibacteria group bacterium]
MSAEAVLSIESYIADHSTLVMVLFVAAIALIFLLVYMLNLSSRKNEDLKEEFITIIAHKFQTPLSQVKWLIESMASAEQDPYKLESLGQIAKANRQLIDLTGTLVELADSDGLARAAYLFEKTDLCELTRRVAGLAKDSFHEKNIFFSVECDREPIYVKVDKARVEFALQVLFDNARLYSPPGKSVRVDVSKIGAKAAITVSDQGIGISPEEFPRLFSKFFRGKNAVSADTEGFGVGLYLADSIVRRHRGRIEVSSPGAGKGSTFKIVLPSVN